MMTEHARLCSGWANPLPRWLAFNILPNAHISEPTRRQYAMPSTPLNSAHLEHRHGSMSKLLPHAQAQHIAGPKRTWMHPSHTVGASFARPFLSVLIIG